MRFTAVFRQTNGRWGPVCPTKPTFPRSFPCRAPSSERALVRLRADGLVTSKPHTGSFVTGHPNSMVLERARTFSISDIQRCFEFRTGVEGEAAYLSALRQSQAKIAKIKASLDSMKAWREGTADSDGAEEDVAFHMAVAAATENNYFTSAMESMSMVIRMGISIGNTLVQYSGGRKSSAAYDEHYRVFEAIVAGDAEAARTLMRTHVENTRRRAFVGR